MYTHTNLHRKLDTDFNSLTCTHINSRSFENRMRLLNFKMLESVYVRLSLTGNRNCGYSHEHDTSFIGIQLSLKIQYFKRGSILYNNNNINGLEFCVNINKNSIGYRSSCKL